MILNEIMNNERFNLSRETTNKLILNMSHLFKIQVTFTFLRKLYFSFIFTVHYTTLMNQK